MSTRPRSRRRELAFAVVATVLGLLALEALARGVEGVRGGGRVDARSNLSFQQLPDGDLLRREADDAGDRWVAEGDWLDRAGWSVLVDKPDDEVRIAWFGGSAAAGWNSPTQATMARILERILDDATPDRRVRVLNLARTGYATPQLAWVAEQTLERLQPDLVLGVMGNNEKHDLVVAAHLAQGEVGPLLLAHRLSRASALVRLLRVARPLEPGAQQELFDPYMLDDQERIVRFATERLGATLARVQAAADGAGARTLFSTVPINERLHGSWGEWAWMGEAADSDPYRVAHWALDYDGADVAIPLMEARLAAHPEERGGRVVLAELVARAGDGEAAARIAGELLTELEGKAPRAEFAPEEQRLWTWAARLAGRPTDPVQGWVDAAEASGDVGSNGCLAAELLHLAGRRAEAKTAFLSCSDRTRFLRGGPAIDARIVEVAATLGVASVDLAGALRELSPSGLAGYRFFWDYCHYNPRGNWVGAHVLAAAAAEVLGLEVALPTQADADREWSEARAGRRVDLLDAHRWAGIDGDPELLTQEYLPDDPRWIGDLGEFGHLGELFSAHRNLGRVTRMTPQTAQDARRDYEVAAGRSEPGVPEAAAEGLRRLARAEEAEGLR